MMRRPAYGPTDPSRSMPAWPGRSSVRLVLTWRVVGCSTWVRGPGWPGEPRWPPGPGRWSAPTPPSACCGGAARACIRWRPRRPPCRSATGASTWCWPRSAWVTWTFPWRRFARPAGWVRRWPPARSRPDGTTRPRRRSTRCSARSATGRRRGTSGSSGTPSRGPATRTWSAGTRPRPVTPTSGCGGSRWTPACPGRPNSRRGGWAWPTWPRSWCRCPRTGGPRCAGRPRPPRRVPGPWWCPCWSSSPADRLPVVQPPGRGPAQGPGVLAGLAGQPLGAVGGGVQPVPDGEIGGGLAGPPPGLHGDGCFYQVKVGGDRVEVDRQAQRPAGPVGQDPGHADVAGYAERGGRGVQPGRGAQGRPRVAAQQRQPGGEQPVLELEPPAEDQLAFLEGPGLIQVFPGRVLVAGLDALLGQVLPGGDGQLGDALADLA